ncbi:MAG: glycosyltransferase family 4 protein [Planctomycetes bacterium]|nr:glycosyltransferase family 4 protein [Planctomycetota bacterium]
MSGSPVVWAGWPHAPAPLAAIRRARRAGAQVVDDAGRPIRWSSLLFLREVMRGAWQRGLDLVLAALAAMLAGKRSPPQPTRVGQPDGAVVLVLPILPDLSHTFVYREVLAILQQRPDWRVVVLEHNALAPVHAEAKALQERAVFLPRHGVTARFVGILRWLLRRGGRELFALYRAQPQGSSMDLLGRNPLRDPRHPGNAFRLADQLAPWRLRAIHVYSSTYAANVALGAAHLLGVPFSISSYVDFEFGYAHKMLAEKVARARFFRVVTTFCQARLRELPGLPALSPDRVPVIYLGLDLQNWQECSAPPGLGVLVSAARLVPKKGLHLVPEALALLRARGVSCRWRVIGDGPETAAITALCAKHGVEDLVVLLGPRDNAAVREELLHADLALLPCVMADDGERDGIPIFLCEAMALGVPIVTTPISGIPELVRDGDTGFLATPGSSASLAEVLQRVLEDRPLAQAVGQRGRALVRDALNVSDKARELIACIER